MGSQECSNEPSIHDNPMYGISTRSFNVKLDHGALEPREVRGVSCVTHLVYLRGCRGC